MSAARLVQVLAIAIFAAVVASDTCDGACPASAEIEHINPPSLFNGTDFGFAQIVTATNVRKKIWISGQTSQDTVPNVLGRTLDEQADGAIANVKRALEAVGATVDDIVHQQIFIANYNPDTDIPIVGKVTNAFKTSNGNFPSAELIGVQSLFTRELLIEIYTEAVLP
ncbi:unnamed protein product [Ostreobium quekettii]|uniref:Uncharacterized protein n=1 Tax=Ostreobium quekettii TaxID=121088 RepID=A0A8S1IN56_9CHLO|nr:unnamed protein product [Ostreobium quekettii]|eukprot:evm.model.scf_26.5 EVM.evm.TU.scf_26.5   scf_26:35018-36230(+)